MLRYYPAPGATDLLSVRSSHLLRPWHFNAGTALDYSYRTLNADIGSSRIHIDPHHIVQHFYFNMGIRDWVQASIDLPVFWYERFRNPDTLGPSEDRMDFGDMRLESKIRVLDEKEEFLGLALLPFLQVPSGEEKLFMGDSAPTGGVQVIVDRTLHEVDENLYASLNMGFVLRDRFNAYGLDIDEQFLLRFGLSYQILDKLKVIEEIDTVTPFAQFYENSKSTWVGLRTGVEWRIDPRGRFQLKGSLLYGVMNGAGMPLLQPSISFAIVDQPTSSFKPKLRQLQEQWVKHVPWGARRELQPYLKEPIHFWFKRTLITSPHRKRLREIAAIMRQHPKLGPLYIHGYSDNLGATSYNQLLARLRAEEVQAYLLKQGVEKDRLIIRFFGEGDPVASNATRLGRAENRRVEIRLDAAPE